jgi:hypothetical protein
MTAHKTRTDYVYVHTQQVLCEDYECLIHISGRTVGSLLQHCFTLASKETCEKAKQFNNRRRPTAVFTRDKEQALI